jgi:hypothetical protein
VGAGAGGGVEELVALRLQVGVGGVDIGDSEGEMSEGGAGLFELTGNRAGGGKGREKLEQRGTGGGLEKDFVDLIGAEDVFAMDDLEAESLVGGELGGELIGGDGEGEVVEAEQTGKRGNHSSYGLANHSELGRGAAGWFAFSGQV